MKPIQTDNDAQQAALVLLHGKGVQGAYWFVVDAIKHWAGEGKTRAWNREFWREVALEVLSCSRVWVGSLGSK